MTDSRNMPGVWPRPSNKMRFLAANGYDHEREIALKIFTKGQVLTVENCDVGDWSHSVAFKGFPGRYNGVMFELIEDAG